MKFETKITLIGFLTMFIVGISDLIVIGILSPMSETFKVTPALMGQLVTIYAIAFSILGPFLTKFTSTFSDKKTLMFALLIFIFVILATTWTNSYFVLCILRVILAGSASIVTIKLLAIGAKGCSAKNKAKVVANIYVGFSAANILGVPLGTLIATYFSWSMTFWLIGLMASICLICIVLFLQVEGVQRESDSQGTYRILSKNGVVFILFFLFLMMVSNSLIFTYLEPLILQYHSLYIVSIALFLSGIAGVIGSKMGNFLAEKWGYIISGLIIVLFYSVALIGLFLWANNMFILLVCVTIWNLFHWGTNPTVQYALLQFIEGDPSQLFSYNLSILNLGIGIGSLIGGLIFTQDTSLRLSLLIALIISLFALVCLSKLKQDILNN